MEGTVTFACSAEVGQDPTVVAGRLALLTEWVQERFKVSGPTNCFFLRIQSQKQTNRMKLLVQCSATVTRQHSPQLGRYCDVQINTNAS